jgi:hypothetical protein
MFSAMKTRNLFDERWAAFVDNLVPPTDTSTRAERQQGMLDLEAPKPKVPRPPAATTDESLRDKWWHRGQYA